MTKTLRAPGSPNPSAPQVHRQLGRAAGGGLALGLHVPFGASERSRARRRHRSQCLGRRAARQHLRHPHRRARRWARARSPASRSSSPRSSSATGRRSPPRCRPPARASPANALGRDEHRRQPRHPHLAGLRAPRRRRRAHHAAAGRGRAVAGAGRRADRRRTASSRMRPRSARPPTARWRPPRRGFPLPDPKSITLKDPRTWKIAGKPLNRLDTAAEAERQQGLCDRRQAAGHAECSDQGLPGVRRQAGELRRREDRRATGRESRGARQRLDRRGRRRHLVARQDGARRAADRVGRGRRCAQSSATIARPLAEGLAADDAYADAQRGRRAEGDRRRGQEGRGGVQHAVPRARDHGADELHRTRTRPSAPKRGCRRRTAKRRSLRCRSSPACRSTNARSTARSGLRLRPARRRPGLRTAGGDDRQAVPGRRRSS